jgi:DNA polymerase-1
MVLTDAMALLYRSHFAFSHDHRLRTSGNRDTTVEFGFLSTVLSLLELSPHPTHFAVVFDASGKTFRHELYTGYKGQRPPAPEEIVNAVPVVQDLLRAMNITEIRVPGVEADDVIGTLARRAVEEEGMAVAVASPDKDFFQLLRPGVILLRPPKKNREDVNRYSLVPYSEDDFAIEWDGLRPEQFVDVLSLMGDSSDNVPGVPGIGPKMAIKLLHQFGSLDEVLRRADEAQPKRAATALATEDALAAARLSKQLVELRTDVDVPSTNLTLDSMRLRIPADGGRAAFDMLAELEFESHAKRLKSLWNMA